MGWLEHGWKGLGGSPGGVLLFRAYQRAALSGVQHFPSIVDYNHLLSLFIVKYQISPCFSLCAFLLGGGLICGTGGLTACLSPKYRVVAQPSVET